VSFGGFFYFKINLQILKIITYLWFMNKSLKDLARASGFKVNFLATKIGDEAYKYPLQPI
jgi:hypothetical protein